LPRIIFQVVVPLHGLVVIAIVLVARSRIHAGTGRDPIVFRPFRGGGTPHAFLESILVVEVGLSLLDVALNAVAREWVEQWLAIPLLLRSAALGWAGLGLVTLGVALYAVAVAQMGRSWRIGIDQASPGPLVTGGLYGRVRHPIYAAVALVMVGLAAAFGEMLAVGVAVAGVVAVALEARLEEEFLRAKYPEEYRAYELRTGRFWPLL
jgi:protein-S-isoprenylcysteine O-methyltransferase Ste14